MTEKKKAKAKAKITASKPKFQRGQRVIYDAWIEAQEMRDIPATVLRLDTDGYCGDKDDPEDAPENCQALSRRDPRKAVWWYHVTLNGDKYPRAVCEDELSLPPPPKFKRGDLVRYQCDQPKLDGEGLVVEVHQDKIDIGTCFYDVWICEKSPVLKQPFRFPESCLSPAKKAKKGRGV